MATERLLVRTRFRGRLDSETLVPEDAEEDEDELEPAPDADADAEAAAFLLRAWRLLRRLPLALLDPSAVVFIMKSDFVSQGRLILLR